MPTWTECWGSFVPAGTGWQNYDIFTNKSVPKGADVYILMLNGNDAADRTLGVRKDGSALERKVLVHEAEAGGSSSLGMWVQVDASTGYIETYCDSLTGVTFYCAGYITNTTFTEDFQDITPTANTTWQDRNLNTLYGTPNGRVVSCVCGVVGDVTTGNVGIRTDSSALSRYINTHEGEGGAGAGNFWTLSVKVSASTGIIEVYGQYYATTKIYYTGYFGSEIDYTETAINRNNVATTGWIDWDVTAYMDVDGRLADIWCGHFSTGAELDYGARINGSSLARYWLEHEAETAGNTGDVLPTQTDTSGILELYASNSTSDYLLFLGYYKYSADQVSVTLKRGSVVPRMMSLIKEGLI